MNYTIFGSLMMICRLFGAKPVINPDLLSIRNTHQWKFIDDNASENVICEMSVIYFLGFNVLRALMVYIVMTRLQEDGAITIP